MAYFLTEFTKSHIYQCIGWPRVHQDLLVLKCLIVEERVWYTIYEVNYIGLFLFKMCDRLRNKKGLYISVVDLNSLYKTVFQEINILILLFNK